MKPMLKPPGNKHLKLKCDIPLLIFAFKFNLRRYIVDTELGRSMKMDMYGQMRSAGMLITPDQGARGQARGGIDY